MATSAASGDGDAARMGFVVCVAGAAGLAVEICASRLLAPFFGNSTIVWANIIGLILAYLAVGYWMGGRLADRRPEPRLLGRLMLVAAASIGLLPFIARPILTVALHALDTLSAGAVVASFFSTLLLFGVPVTLLGMVTPFAIRLAMRDVGSAGAVAGRLYALSTVGSIGGTFVPALLTIPLVGTQRTMLGTAVLLSAAAVSLLKLRAAALAGALALFLLIPPGLVKEQAGLVVQQESAYEFVSVLQLATGERDLQLNEGVANHSVWRPGTVLTGGEWDMFLVVPPLVDHPVRHVLILGNAGGTMARQYSKYYPSAQIDGVELDPAVTQVGRDYLGLNDATTLTVHDGDGRAFLALSHDSYDVIIVDAYRQPYIPFYLATQEFFQLCRNHLTPGGVLALNVERIPGDAALATTVESTVASVMPNTWQWHALKFNELLVAVNSRGGARPTLHAAMPSDIGVLGDLFTANLVAADTTQTPMTDDRAPVEWLTDRSLLSYILGGGRLDERGLPTGR